MASQSGNSNNALYFIVGMIVVVLIGVGILAYTGNSQSPVESGAEAVQGAAEQTSEAVTGH